MATRSKKPAPDTPASAPAFEPPPSHNIWLAGLGALASAQANAHAEGSKAFEALVKQGLEMQARTQALAKAQWAGAAERMGSLTADASGAVGSWDRLGGIFEGRVARAMASLGMPSAAEVETLKARVDALEAAVQALQAKASAGSNKPAPRPRKTAR